MPAPALVLLRLLPQHLVSRLAGRAASLRLPRALRRPLLAAFGRAVGIDFAEVPGRLEDYASLQEFFVRPLPDGARPLDQAPSSVVAPCDGFWGAAGVVERGILLQVKGRPYSVAALLGGAAAASSFEGGAYATFYLAPRNYHRFHAPVAARLTRLVHLPGTLWPVNRLGLENIDGLFARNERLAAFLEVGGGALCLVAVGATMVGKVRVTFDDLTTNSGATVPVERRYEPPLDIRKGEEWGRFEFGSTIVMLASPGWMSLEVQSPGTPLRLGARIGERRR